VGAEPGERHAIPLQRHAQLLQGELAVLRDALYGPVELHIVHAQRRFPGVLQLHAIADQAVEQLLLQVRARRQRRALLFQLQDGEFETLVEIETGDDFIVYHRHDAVEHNDGARLLRQCRRRRARECGGEHQQARERRNAGKRPAIRDAAAPGINSNREYPALAAARGDPV
jgi:hypothetical protein